MAHLLAGILMGLTLAIMAGPIFFMLVQTGIERGVRAGIAVGAGEWISDIFYIAATYFGLSWVLSHVDEAKFKFYMGLGGGVLLMIFGVVTLLSKPAVADKKHTLDAKSLFGYFFKGFSINTFNPFTLFFWISTTGAYVIKNHLLPHQAALFYSGIIGTIAIFDVLKVGASRGIRPYMKPSYMVLMRKASGVALAGFGLAMLVRALI